MAFKVMPTPTHMRILMYNLSSNHPRSLKRCAEMVATTKLDSAVRKLLNTFAPTKLRINLEFPKFSSKFPKENLETTQTQS